jgi:hypothetical protein
METSLFIIITYYFNCLLGIADRVLQICYYCFTRKNDAFEVPTADKITLTFIILPFGLNFILITIYCLFHHEEQITILTKIKSFFLYLISTELLYPIGVQTSFKTKFSENADNPIVTMKLLNGIHVMFISIPQILIISINSSAHEDFTKLDISSLVISIIFIIWSIVYYFLCAIKEIEYDDFITYSTYKEHDE